MLRRTKLMARIGLAASLLVCIVVVISWALSSIDHGGAAARQELQREIESAEGTQEQSESTAFWFAKGHPPRAAETTIHLGPLERAERLSEITTILRLDQSDPLTKSVRSGENVLAGRGLIVEGSGSSRRIFTRDPLERIAIDGKFIDYAIPRLRTGPSPQTAIVDRQQAEARTRPLHRCRSLPHRRPRSK